MAVLIELLPHLCGGLLEHQGIAGEGLPSGSQQRSVRRQCFAPHFLLATTSSPAPPIQDEWKKGTNLEPKMKNIAARSTPNLFNG